MPLRTSTLVLSAPKAEGSLVDPRLAHIGRCFALVGGTRQSATFHETVHVAHLLGIVRVNCAHLVRPEMVVTGETARLGRGTNRMALRAGLVMHRETSRPSEDLERSWWKFAEDLQGE